MPTKFSGPIEQCPRNSQCVRSGKGKYCQVLVDHFLPLVTQKTPLYHRDVFSPVTMNSPSGETWAQNEFT